MDLKPKYKADLFCGWHFSQKNGGVAQGPNDAMGDTFKKLPYTSLVRESLQNSLDAACGDEPVIVTFKNAELRPSDFPELMDLETHIQACIKTFDNEDARSRFEPMLSCLAEAKKSNCLSYLEVSDENTTGMEYKSGNKKSPFYAFVKSIGYSVKSGNTKGGSKGYGKAAYFNCSALRTVLISTKTEKGYSFEGVTGLCTHDIKGKSYESHGFYTNGDQKNELPVTEEKQIPSVFRRKTIGTSAFILGVDNTDKGRVNMVKEITRSVIRNFWMAILEKKLIVKIAINKKNVEINAATINKFAAQIFSEVDDNKTTHDNPRPYIEAYQNVNKDFNHRYFESITKNLGKIELYLHRNKSGNDMVLFMRSPMMLVKSKKNGTNYGFYAVFLCRDEKGNKLLRAMENGRHDDWDYRECPPSSKEREKAKNAEKEIKNFIDECIKQVFRSGKNDFLTFAGLDEFLSIPASLDENEDWEDPTMESDEGSSKGERQEYDTTDPTTEVNKEGVAEDEGTEEAGEVIIEEPAGTNEIEDGGEGFGDNGTRESDDTGSSGGSQNEGTETGESGGSNGTNEGGPTTTAGGGSGYNPDDGENTRRSILRVDYRAFAQVCSGGYVHKLVIKSNRASENCTIFVTCAGESSGESIPLSSTDQGHVSGNVISNVKLQQGRNVINIQFADDMRHSIALAIHEEKQ